MTAKPTTPPRPHVPEQPSDPLPPSAPRLCRACGAELTPGEESPCPVLEGREQAACRQCGQQLEDCDCEDSSAWPVGWHPTDWGEARYQASGVEEYARLPHDPRGALRAALAVADTLGDLDRDSAREHDGTVEALYRIAERWPEAGAALERVRALSAALDGLAATVGVDLDDDGDRLAWERCRALLDQLAMLAGAPCPCGEGVYCDASCACYCAEGLCPHCEPLGEEERS